MAFVPILGSIVPNSVFLLFVRVQRFAGLRCGQVAKGSNGASLIHHTFSPVPFSFNHCRHCAYSGMTRATSLQTWFRRGMLDDLG